MLLAGIAAITLVAVVFGGLYVVATNSSELVEREPIIKMHIYSNEVYATPGQLVIFHNNDTRQHHIMAGGFDSRQMVFGSPIIEPGITRTFKAPTDDTRWICDIHPWLTGMIYVN